MTGYVHCGTERGRWSSGPSPFADLLWRRRRPVYRLERCGRDLALTALVSQQGDVVYIHTDPSACVDVAWALHGHGYRGGDAEFRAHLAGFMS